MRYQLHQFGIRRVGEPNKYLTSPGDTVKELNALSRHLSAERAAREQAERERDEWEKKNAHNVALYERELSDARRALVWFAAHCAEPDWARAAVRAARGEKQKEVVDGE